MGITYELVSVRQSIDPTALLTDRQHWLITEATERGYYDSLRGCTLTELAAALAISKSVASQERPASVSASFAGSR